MTKKQFDKDEGLKTLMTTEEAKRKGWDVLDAPCSDNPKMREAQAAKMVAKYPIHLVACAVLIHDYPANQWSKAYWSASVKFIVKRNANRVMGIVEKAVESLRTESVAYAIKKAKQEIAGLVKKMEKAGWDLNKVAPYVAPVRYNDPNRAAYDESSALRSIYRRFFKNAESYQRDEAETFPMVRNPEAEARHISDAEYAANASFDAYVFKMVKKIGAAEAAEVSESYGIWNHSILKIVKTGGAVELWKTQMIVNVSVLGKFFNQWPTRLIKEGK